MSATAATTQRTPEMRLLEQLVTERGIRPGDYALFFTTGEGDYLPIETPEPIEEISGFLIDRTGRVFSWWLAWDPDGQRPVLVDWEQAEPEPHWRDVPEYQDARRQMGL